MNWSLSDIRYWDDLLFTVTFSREPPEGEIVDLQDLIRSWYRIGVYGGYGGILFELGKLERDHGQAEPRFSFVVNMGSAPEIACEILHRCMKGWARQQYDDDRIKEVIVGELPGQDRRAWV